MDIFKKRRMREMRENVDWAPRGREEEEVEEASLESESARPRGQAGPSHTLNWEYGRLRHPTSRVPHILGTL